MLDELESERPGGMVKYSFAQAATAWVERHRRWSPKTLKETRYALRRYILPALGGTRFDRITPAQIEDLYASWVDEGRADATMRRWHGIIRSIFADAMRLGILSKDPMVRVTPAGGHAPERLHIPAPAEVRRAIDAATPVASIAFELAAVTGARRGTIVALRWRDVDLEGATIVFSHAIAVGENGPVMKGTKTNRPYAVSLGESVLARLREHKRRATETAMNLGRAGDLRDLFVFSSDGGVTPWRPENLTHAWSVACARAEVVGSRLHDLRHFAASQMLAARFSHRTVAERLGCTETNVLKTYSHWVPTLDDARAAEVMEDVLSG
ncbi:MAG TPA: tyrosine-type recombinase/integrase [Acidimicrobiales bacterium]|nr:tyrosine-type recombinase/integrase [Acidimicrobiales bacterium]